VKLLSSDTIRRCLIADPGKVIISADFDQIELRVIAALAGEKVMIDAAHRGESLHKTTAAQMFGESYSPDEYRYSKNLNFGWAFGGGAKTLAEQTGLPMAKCAALIKEFENAFPALRAWKRREQQAIMDQVLNPLEMKRYRALRTQLYPLRADTRDGIQARKIIQAQIDALFRGKTAYCTNAFGRRMIVDASKAYTVINYKVQSTAAELMKHSLIDVMDIPRLEPTVLLVVHDELIGQAPVRSAEQIAKMYGAVMTREFMGVPITAAGKVYGRSWGDGYS
jgi:DNA polymerase-1